MELKKDGISDRNSKSFVQFIPFWGQKKSGILNVQKKEEEKDMKKRLLGLTLACTMTAMSLAGCGGSSSGTDATTAAADGDNLIDDRIGK